jgi:hypothetical protein
VGQSKSRAFVDAARCFQASAAVESINTIASTGGCKIICALAL